MVTLCRMCSRISSSVLSFGEVRDVAQSGRGGEHQPARGHDQRKRRTKQAKGKQAQRHHDEATNVLTHLRCPFWTLRGGGQLLAVTQRFTGSRGRGDGGHGGCGSRDGWRRARR